MEKSDRSQKGLLGDIFNQSPWKCYTDLQISPV